MRMEEFTADNLHQVVMVRGKEKGSNGQVTIIGGSNLFHGAPILSLIAASRAVDMVFFASPQGSLGEVASRLKAKLASFIWIPWEEIDRYIEKSDAVLIGPGFMRYRSEKAPGDGDKAYWFTKKISEELLSRFSSKNWVIDGGSLQTIDPKIIPTGSVLTPNRKEFEKLFGEVRDETYEEKVTEMAKKYKCVVAGKGPERMFVTDGNGGYVIPGGGVPLTQGGTGDVLAGVIVGLLAKNPPLISAAAAGFLVQRAVRRLADQVGSFFNSDDLAWEVGRVWEIEMRNKK